jgi:uncharacterized membrane protein YfcA
VTDLLLIFLAGVGAGTINAVVGSGTLITFPVLLALGYPPVTANISNNVGLVPGSASATWGYRRELDGQQARSRLLTPLSLLGATMGALLLLVLPARWFATVVPALIAIALVLVIVQPRLQAALAGQRTLTGEQVRSAMPASRARTVTMAAGVFAAGVYGGYFGAAQGILLIAVLGSLLPDTLQRINGLKNLLSTVVNGVAAVVFCLVAWAQIDWLVAGLIAVGSVIGGQLGSAYGRRLPPMVLRAVIVVVGLTAIARLVLG